ncbi:MAG TPA: S8 family peptidase, partial [Myxococcaceae bacterium]|nr:S8 family peptidase [Myxococcaceae bacterium]
LRAEKPGPTEYIVVLKEQPGPSAAAISGVAQAMAGQHGASVLRTYEHALRGFVIRGSEAQARALANNPNVAYVQENGYVELAATQAPVPSWGLDRIDQENLPLDNSYTYETDASNVHAYIIDTGILASHSEFEGRANTPFDSINDGQNGNDCNGHGTHVAGTVGGKSYGVAKKVKLHGVRVLSCSGGGAYDGVIAGVDWVRANAIKPAVANMSLGGGAYQALDDAITNAVNSGIPFIVAAGNSNLDACNSSPARTPKAVTVGATDSNDAKATFSNWGSCLDIFAPGVNIPSAWIGGNTATKTISGTSMAAPHVAGAAALLLAKGVSAANVPSTLVADATLNKVTNPNGSPNRLLFTGTRGTPLTNGVFKTGLGGATGSTQNFYLDVPAGVSTVTFTVTGGTGDADLYVRHGAIPTTVDYDCRPLRSGNEEICTMFNASPGRWYAQLRAYSTYSGVSLKGQY